MTIDASVTGDIAVPGWDDIDENDNKEDYEYIDDL